jgi:hypothetical protein
VTPLKRIAILLLAGFALDGARPEPASALERTRVEATRIDGEIRVDGALDEPEWSRAASITDFRLIFQREGEKPTEATDLRVLVDEQRVYLAITCDNVNPGAVRASLAPRDQITDGDFVAIHLDTYRDLRRAYIFGVNPYGVQLDGILDGGTPDFTWDAVWDAETKRGARGWTAEIAIPLRAMRFPRGGDGVWGLWVRRDITKNDEVCSWPLWRQEEQGDIMLQAADLAGMTGLHNGGGFDVEPYIGSLVEVQDNYPSLAGSLPIAVDGDNFTLDGRAENASVSTGVDLRYPLTTALIANATVNPDYSQIEADAIQIDVNQRYPLYYPEKRPFFQEGAEIFTTPLNLVYTRRIANPVVGGKLTGQLGAATLGAITLRDDGFGSLEGIGAGPQGGVSGQGEFHIGRFAHDVGDNSRLGVLATFHRADRGRIGGASDDPLAIAPEGQNLVAAGDARLRLARALFFTGQMAWSETDADAFSGSGFSDIAYASRLRYADGVRELQLYQNYVGPEFRTDAGFVERIDARTSGVDFNFFVRPENAWLRSWQPILNGYVVHDHTGELQDWRVTPAVDWLFQKQTTLNTMYVRARERWQGVDYDLNRYVVYFENTLWRPLAFSFDMDVGDGIFYGDGSEPSFRGWSEIYEWGATVRPDPRLTAELVANRQRFSVARGGDEIYDVWALGAKTTFQITRRLSARIYPQYQTDGRHLDVDALVGYVLHPGSVLYVGVNGDYARDDAGSSRHLVIFKASHRFGL